MSERNQGKVIPFAISASRLRRGAAAHRKQGRPVEAVELMRQAALRDGTAQGLMALSRQLEDVQCHEQALRELYRLVARDDAPDDTWMELARNQQALGQTESAVDSLYHYLQLDPYSDASDDARDMLADLEEDDEAQEAFRLSLLIRRALASWQAGRQEESLRRFRRAERIALHPARIRVTAALLLLSSGRAREALREAVRATHEEPDNPRAATLVCVALSSLGKKRMARAMLVRSASLCPGPAEEDVFLSAAWALSADDVLEKFLTDHLRRAPCRVPLLSAMADLCWRTGRRKQAEGLWHRILRLDPEDARAATLLRVMPSHPEAPLPPDGLLPRGEVRERMLCLARAIAADTPAQTLLAPGSQTRLLTDWCFTLADSRLQTTVLEAVARDKSDAAHFYLRQLLTCPTVLPAVRQQVMLRLAGMGDTGPMCLMVGPRLTTARCAETAAPGKNMWRMFLRLLLGETRAYRQSSRIAFFAADLWRLLPRDVREKASGSDSYAWVKAAEILYLRKSGQDAAAARVIRELQVSSRRISRILRYIVRRVVTPEGEPHEVH